MRWSRGAEEAISKVPFFVRKRVRRKVEEEASRAGAAEVTLNHVKTCQARFLDRMEEEVKGYQVETCFGPAGCPNRAVGYENFASQVEERIARRELKSFLRERVGGPLKYHHEFRVSISDCPNACSRPQIVDLGLIGGRKPGLSESPCSQCGSCVQVCREGAISLEESGPVLDPSKCLSCGQCITACPTGTLEEKERGYRILLGGKLGRHPKLGLEIPGLYAPEETLKMIDRVLDHYQKHCRRGERLGEILDRTGTGEITND